MKRHLLGFALFNLIVGTAMMIAILTGNFPRPATRYVHEVSRSSCRMKVRQNFETRKDYENNQDSIKVTQAVSNEKTRKVNISFLIQRETPTTQDIEVKLTFFNSGANREWEGAIQTEYVRLSPNFNVDNKSDYSIPLSYEWLNDFGRRENLYVKAEIYNGSSADLKDISGIGSLDDFTPVLLMNKK